MHQLRSNLDVPTDEALSGGRLTSIQLYAYLIAQGLPLPEPRLEAGAQFMALSESGDLIFHDETISGMEFSAMLLRAGEIRSRNGKQ